MRRSAVFFQAEDGIRDWSVTGVQTCALPISRMAMGMEAYVTVVDKSLHRLYELDLQFGAQLHTAFSTVETIEREVEAADLVIGAVLVPGAAAPKLVSRALVQRMRPGAVLADIAID